MSVPIIEGMEELESFTTFIQLNSETQQIEYLSELPSKGVSTTTGGIADGVIKYHGPLNFKIPDFQPNLTGGSKAGAEAVAVTETTAGYEVTTGVGTVTSVSLIEILGGIFAGLGLGVLSYEANKDFWIDISNNLFLNLPGYVPITYENIEDMSLLALFKDNKTYIDADLVQRVNNYLIEIGAFTGTYEVEVDIPREAGEYEFNSPPVTAENLEASFSKLLNYYQQYKEKIPPKRLIMLRKAFINAMATITTAAYQNSNCYGIILQSVGWGDGSESSYYNVYIRLYNKSLPLSRRIGSSDINEYYTDVPSSRFSTVFFVSGSVRGTPDNITEEYGYVKTNDSDYSFRIGFDSSNNAIWSLNNNIQIIPTIPELPLLDGAVISTTPDSLPTEQNLWWIHKITLPQADPATGTVTEKQLVPLTVPSTSPKTSPITDPATQAQIQTGMTPQTNTDPIGQSATNPFTTPNSVFTPPSTPTPTPTPTPAIPVIPAIGGQANKLFTVYNPSQANLDSLGATLWTQNIITQIVQMFTNNPMDAIISLHILYATPTTGANKEIKLGYVPTGVSCPEVTNQYINVNCGTVRVPELFGDARDYANTDISIYLPMIGFRQLKTEDAMGSVVGVDYRVDVFTGTVLATVTITKAGVNQVFYTYEGNCAVNLPLTGADKSRQVATAVGAIGAMVTGSPLMAMGSATAIAGGSARAQIQRSGNFTGNAGAMGCKKPYIIVSSDVPYDAAGYQTQYGYPANLTVMLGDCSGYVKVKEVHADAISNATEDEKRYIENQLKQGIIIH